jgi:hypothetical protein
MTRPPGPAKLCKGCANGSSPAQMPRCRHPPAVSGEPSQAPFQEFSERPESNACTGKLKEKAPSQRGGAPRERRAPTDVRGPLLRGDPSLPPRLSGFPPRAADLPPERSGFPSGASGLPPALRVLPSRGEVSTKWGENLPRHRQSFPPEGEKRTCRGEKRASRGESLAFRGRSLPCRGETPGKKGENAGSPAACPARQRGTREV